MAGTALVIASRNNNFGRENFDESPEIHKLSISFVNNLHHMVVIGKRFMRLAMAPNPL